jgi:hypothetical protein
VSRRHLLPTFALALALIAPGAGASAEDTAPTPAPAGQGEIVPGGIRGADLSWPNCPKGMGVAGRRTQGLPLPRNRAQFWVIGLTNGRAFTANPCLSQHIAAARERGVLTAAYTMLSYPNRAERAAHGASGPFGALTRADRLANVGYAQAAFALDVMEAAALPAPFVWIDVEHRAERPWSRKRPRNRALLQGALRAAQDRGVGSGIYTYAGAWQSIMGRMQVDVPLWAPGHSRAGSFSARRRQTWQSCSRTGFTGGPLVMTQWVWRNRDHDITCPVIESISAPLWVRLDSEPVA